MTRRWLPAVVWSFGTLFAGALAAAVPDAISYQGVLLNASGQPVNVPTNLRFRILRGGDEHTFPSTGVLTYHERAIVVPTAGVFSHMIGTGTPAADCAAGLCVLDAGAFAPGNVPAWIEVTIDPDGVAWSIDDDVLLPRTRVGTVGYAYRVASIDGAAGGTMTGTVAADLLVGRSGAELGDPSASTVDLRFDASGGSANVHWNPAAPALEFDARTRHALGLTIDPGQQLRFGAKNALTTDAASSVLQIGAGFPLATFPSTTRFDSAVEFLSPATFRGEVTLETEKGLVQQARNTFPGGQTDGSLGDGVKLRNFVHEPFDAGSDAPGSVPGEDTELIWAGPYYNANPMNLLARENPADYSLGFQFTAGWTHLSGGRNAEYFWRHITKEATTWYPFAWNIVDVDTETPLLDYTIYTAPGQIALQVNPTTVAIHGPAVGRGDLEISSGAGTLYVGGATGGKVKFEGMTDDENQTEVRARDASEDRAIEFPDASGQVHLNPYNPHVGTVMFGDSEDTADTGNEVCESVHLICVHVRTIDGADSDCTSDQGIPGTLFHAFCRR